MKKTMKVILLIMLMFVTCKYVHAQADLKSAANSGSQVKQSENVIRTANDLKSGNWQDILSNFLQLSISDLTGVNKALNFKSTLFALKAKADSALLIDSNYVRQKFARNFQFDFSLKLDSSYKFNGFQAGFTWAIVNKRDSTVLSYAGTLIDSVFLIAEGDLIAAFQAYTTSVSDSSGNILPDKLQVFKNIKQKVEDVLKDSGFAATKLFPSDFQPFLKAAYIAGDKKGYDENIKIANYLFDSALAKLRAKPLLTLSVNSTFKNNQRALNNGEAQLVYLQGIYSKRRTIELDFRASVNDEDTVVINTMQRAVFKASAGINFSLFQRSNHHSIFEFKPYFSYQSILTKPISDEKDIVYAANADLRLRITDNLWIPFSIKYDLKKGNLFGFLNVAFNFNSFKK